MPVRGSTYAAKEGTTTLSLNTWAEPPWAYPTWPKRLKLNQLELNQLELKQLELRQLGLGRTTYAAAPCDFWVST
jgi:hypothetical protein